MIRRRWKGFLFAGFALLVLSACGDDDAAPVTSSPMERDVCAMLTTDEITDATGMAVASTENRDSPPFFECLWTGEASLSVDVVVRESSQPSDIRNEDAELISGLGDFAQYYAEPIPILEVLEGRWYLAVSPRTAPGAREASIELARLLLERLP